MLKVGWSEGPTCFITRTIMLLWEMVASRGHLTYPEAPIIRVDATDRQVYTLNICSSRSTRGLGISSPSVHDGPGWPKEGFVRHILVHIVKPLPHHEQPSTDRTDALYGRAMATKPLDQNTAVYFDTVCCSYSQRQSNLTRKHGGRGWSSMVQSAPC